MRLLIINSSPDTCEMLEAYFRHDGWETAVLALKPLRERQLSGKDIMTTYLPSAILLDVAIPYERNWAVLQQLRSDRDVTCPIVVTTTNESAIRRLVGQEERVQEIVGKPYDLGQLQDAVLTALARTDIPRLLPKVERRVGDRRIRDRRR